MNEEKFQQSIILAVVANVSSDVIFDSGSADNDTECVEVFIIDDDALEENQTVALTLTTLDPDVVLATNTTTISIIDDDC